MSELYDILKASNFSSSGGGDIDTSAYATALLMAINSDTYVLSSSLKNENGETLGTPQTIDLPLETMVVGGSYDDTTKKVILTLKNGNTVVFSVADLVSGLQTEITSSNKLNSDLVDDTDPNVNKFVTSAEKTKIANALTEEVYNAGKQVKNGNVTGEIFNDYTNNKATGSYSHAEGTKTTASGNISHAEGIESIASGAYSHAEGWSTTASGSISHAEGALAKAIGYYSHAEGYNTRANSRYQHVQGKFNIEDLNDKYAFIIGNGANNDERSNAFAVDWEGKIYVNNSATGVNVSQLQPIIDSTNKLNSDLINDTNQNNKFVTSAEKTKIANALTEEVYNAGKQITMNDKTGEIFNGYSRNVASGDYSHAEGDETTASGDYSHAEGDETTASGDYSHAEGGSRTTASGDYSHAEGAVTTASGPCSHAEGGSTTASGNCSHAEGGGTTASGDYSHAEGDRTKAASDYQHVQGKYNVEDSNSKYAFIIGNGTSNSARSNAFAVDWNGLIYVNNSATGVDVSDLLSRITTLENKVATLENA